MYLEDIHRLQATGPPRSGAGVGVGMLRGDGADTPREALYALLTLLEGPLCFIDTPGGPYVLY